MHYVPRGHGALAHITNRGLNALTPASRNPIGATPMSDDPPTPAAKTHLCNKFSTAEGCKFGDKCHFAHGERELVRSLHSGHEHHLMGGRPAGRIEHQPPHGERGLGRPLHSGHEHHLMGGRPAGRIEHQPPYGERELGRPPMGGRPAGRIEHQPPYGERELGRPLHSGHEYHPIGGRPAGRHEHQTPPGLGPAASFGASATAKTSVNASLAGAIIGKGGVNTKQIYRLTGAKIYIREHETDLNLRNIELEGTFDQIKQATGMVRELIVDNQF